MYTIDFSISFFLSQIPKVLRRAIYTFLFFRIIFVHIFVLFLLSQTFNLILFNLKKENNGIRNFYPLFIHWLSNKRVWLWKWNKQSVSDVSKHNNNKGTIENDIINDFRWLKWLWKFPFFLLLLLLWFLYFWFSLFF